MRVLAIETAIMNRGSTALLNKGKIVEERYCRKNSYRDRLWPAMEKVLKRSKLSLSEIEGLAVSQGPGSFTGLRVGVATSKTLALSLKKPIIAVPTLETLAYGLDICFMKTIKILVPILDAKKNLVYGAIFRREDKDDNLERESGDLVLTIDEICRMIKEPAIFLGEGLEVYQKDIEKKLGGLVQCAPQDFFWPKASILAQIGEKRLKLKQETNLYEFQPIYLRRPEIFRKEGRI